MMAKKNHFVFIVFCFCLLTTSFFITSPVAAATTANLVITGNIVYTPVAKFTSNVTEGTAPLPVGFTDLSTGVPETWYWEFGDGTNSTDQNPAHTYASGIYTVNLTITNAAGQSTKVSTDLITAYASKKTLTYTTTTGLTGTTAVSLNLSEFSTSGASQSLSGNALTLSYPAGSAFSQMTINLDSADTSKGNISGTVSSVTLETAPITGTLPSSGESEKHTLTLKLNSLPPSGAAIHTTVIEGADSDSNDKFQTYASANGLSVLGTSFELVVSHDIPSSSITNAEITMEVPASWYNTYGSNTVRVMRIDSGGSVTMLDTTFSGFDGSNAVYTARSPEGLSIFAIISLQGSTGGGSSGGQSSTGGGGGSVGTSELKVAAKAQQPQVNPQPQVPVQQPGQVLPGVQVPQLLAPAEGSLVSQAIDLSPYSRFMYTDPSGRPGAIIERAAAERSGATLSVSGKTLEIVRPGFTLSITAGTMNEVNGVIQADNIQSIMLATTPVEAGTSGAGQVTSSFTAGLASLPPDAAITATIADPVNPYVVETFQNAVAHEGDEIQAIAYTLTVQKTNIAATLPATIKMSAPAEWVAAHGGINSIVIGRIADDHTSSILKTSFSGYDKNGNMVFVADSPQGLSVFGFIATKGPLQTRIGEQGFMIPILQNPVLATIFVLVVLVILIAVLVTGFVLWRERRAPAKKPGRQEKR